MASLAELLDYDQRKKQMLDALQTGFNKSYSVADAFTHGLADQVGGVVGLMTTDPRETISNLYQAGKSVVQNPKAAYQAAKEGLTEAVSSPENIARFAGQNFSPADIANALNKVGTIRELTVYHGTPHTLPPTANNPLGEFDASKIGTGEGAASYGHGIYLAQNPKVAEAYKERLTANKYTKDDKYVNADQIWSNAFVSALDASKANPDKVANVVAEIKNWVEDGEDVNDFLRYSRVSPELRPAYEAAIKEYQGSTKNLGHRYTVDLPDEKIDQMLDWDKPLSEQKTVMKQLQKHLEKKLESVPDKNVFLADGQTQLLHEWLKNPEEQGKYFYSSFSDLAKTGNLTKNQQAASSFLKEAGIPGIKYLDEQSREKGAGTRNFVVFPGEEKSLKILSRE